MRINKEYKIITLILCIFLLFPLNTRAVSDGSTLRKQVLTLIKSCSKYDVKRIRACAGGKNVLHTTEKTFIKLIKKGNKKYFSADIAKIKISGNKATVYVNVTQLSGWNVTSNALADYASGLDLSPRALKNAIKKAYYFALTEPEEDEVITKRYKLQYEKKDGKWIVTPNKALYELMDGGMCTQLLDFTKHPERYV